MCYRIAELESPVVAKITLLLYSLFASGRYTLMLKF